MSDVCMYEESALKATPRRVRVLPVLAVVFVLLALVAGLVVGIVYAVEMQRGSSWSSSRPVTSDPQRDPQGGTHELLSAPRPTTLPILAVLMGRLMRVAVEGIFVLFIKGVMWNA